MLRCTDFLILLPFCEIMDLVCLCLWRQKGASRTFPFTACPTEPAKFPSQQLIKAVLICFCESFNRCLSLNPVQRTFHSLFSQIGPQIKRHILEKVKQHVSLLVCPKISQQPQKSLCFKSQLPALTAVPAIISCYVLSKTLPLKDTHTHHLVGTKME